LPACRPPVLTGPGFRKLARACPVSERAQRLVAEFCGTAFLLGIVVGSGIMGERLSAGNAAVALLANSIATGAGLYALISALLSTGAHFNPAVTLLAAWQRQLDARLAMSCMAVQFVGAVVGVMAAHLMFAEPLLQASATDRLSWPLAFAEVVATAGLLGVVSLVPKHSIAAAVAAYITAAYWFTASTSFANPAVTVARALTATFAGIAWPGVPAFIAAQLVAVGVVFALRGLASSASEPLRPRIGQHDAMSE
jgi:glycerol uptake facilitator-like aquaporin